MHQMRAVLMSSLDHVGMLRAAGVDPTSDDAIDAAVKTGKATPAFSLMWRLCEECGDDVDAMLDALAATQRDLAHFEGVVTQAFEPAPTPSPAF